MGTVEFKNPRGYLDSLNRATFSEGVEYVFVFTNKCFRVARNNERVGLKTSWSPLGIC